jgi:Trk K+ transport system NAD-binding subunit
MRRSSYHWLKRKLRANLRDTLILVRQFLWPLLSFGGTLIIGGLLYYYLARQANEPLGNLSEAIYLVLSLTFLQSLGDFPSAWFLEIFFFVMPIIGISILAQGIAEFGVALFNRRTRSKEWEVAVASTFENHTVLVGLGHLGFRVVSNLHHLDQEVVVIEQNPAADLVATAQQMGIPVLQDDGTRESAQLAAGVDRARAIILCTQNDSLNLQMAVKARTLNPNIQVVVRIFDDDFAAALQKQFGFIAMSATSMAAPAFATAAAGVNMTRPITIEGRSLSLASVAVRDGVPLASLTIGQVETNYEVSVVLLQRQGKSDYHPASSIALEAGDILAVLGGMGEISILVQKNS